MAELLVLAAAMAAVGAGAGFIGGLFGVGGGIVMTPALYWAFGHFGVAEAVRMHAAVATSLSVIVATSMRSLLAHRARGAVDDAVLRSWGPWIAAGGAAGAAAASLVSGAALQLVFGVVALALALQFGLGGVGWRLGAALPGGVLRAALGGGLGVLSAMMGIGGGAMGVTLMTLFGRPIHQAVATASGFGALIAVPSVLGYMLAGWGAEGLAPGSLGYVNVLGFLSLTVMSVLAAPLGVRAAHALNQALLRRLFAVFLGVTAVSFLLKAL